MLLINETKLTQVYYDNWGEKLVVEPGTARYFPEAYHIGPGLRIVESALELAKDGHIGIQRGGGLGDLLFLTPALSSLKKAGIENISIECARNHVGLLDGIPGIKTMARFNGQVNLDLNWSCETAERDGWAKPIIRTKVFAQIMGVKLADTRPVAAASPKARHEIKEKYQSGKPLIVFAPSGAAPDRSLELPAARSLARALFKETGSEVAVVGWQIPGQWDNGPWVNLNGKLSITELKALVANADMVVGMDSGISYLGVALGRPTAICMSTIPTESRIDEKWANVIIVRMERQHECRPCWGSHDQCKQRLSCVTSVDTALIAEELAERFEALKEAA